jgi:hypothetical protein
MPKELDELKAQMSILNLECILLRRRVTELEQRVDTSSIGLRKEPTPSVFLRRQAD